MGIITEIKEWVVLYGRSANSKYRTAMVDFFKFVTSFTKQLSRPLNDLDDVRFAMATLIELRNQEIQMDMEVTPIEVSAKKIIRSVLI